MNEIIHEIVSKAEALHERIEYINALGKQELSGIAEIRLREWKAVCALGEEEIFRRRLINDDMSDSEILPILSETTNTHSAQFPEWALKFDEIFESLLVFDYHDVKTETRLLLQFEEFTKIPFLDLLVSIVNFGVNDLQIRAGKSREILGDKMIKLLKLQLFRILSDNTESS